MILFLISYITSHLEREELNELEDQGMTELLILKDLIVEFQKTAQKIAQDKAASNAKQTDLVQGITEEQRLLKEIETLELALSLQKESSQSNGDKKSVSGEAKDARQVHAPFQKCRISVQWKK